MESLKLSQQEIAFYGELFQNWDVEGTGKISGPRASELLMSSALNQESLVQITELCGAKRLGHFGRSQFYIALKLIAAVQQGLPLRLDSLGVDLKLPKFAKISPTDTDKRLITHAANVGLNAEGERGQHPVNQTGQLPPPPINKHKRNLSGQYRSMTDAQSAVHVQINNRDGSPLTAKSPPFSPSQTSPTPSSPPVMPHSQAPPLSSVSGKVLANHSHGINTQALINTSMSNVIHQGQYGMNSVNVNQDSDWASFEGDGECEGLLGGVKKTYNLEPPAFDSSSISSDQESVDDCWSITDEQMEYYIKQFQMMQPDLNGAILGSVAKEFFEKSKLPVTELSKIWQLSDLNRDGALSKDEFCIAMHLVVLRRNDIELPDKLPLSLMPYTAFTNEDFEGEKDATLKRIPSPPSSPQQNNINNQWPTQATTDSPQASSEMSSPNSQPVNFEFVNPVPSDPEARIVHPKAMRVGSPDQISIEQPERNRAFSEPGPPSDIPLKQSDVVDTSLSKQRSNTDSVYSDNSHKELPPGGKTPARPTPGATQGLQSRPRPVPTKVPGAGGGLLIPAPVSSQPGTEVNTTDRPPLSTTASLDTLGQEPPVPPPRPNHTRSISVDSSQVLPTPPAVPPRASPKDVASPAGTIDVIEDEDGKKAPVLSVRQINRDKKDLSMAIRTHKERNSTLERLNSELNQELQEVMEQRIALEIQLEHLKPFSS